MKAFRAQPVGDGYLSWPGSSSPSGPPTWSGSWAGQSVWPAPPLARVACVVDDGFGPGRADRGAGRAAGRRARAAAVPEPAEHHVTGRAPLAPVVPDDIGPFDERVFNPIGFESVVDGPAVELASLGTSRRRPGASLRPAKGVRAERLDDVDRCRRSPRSHGRRVPVGRRVAGGRSGAGRR